MSWRRNEAGAYLVLYALLGVAFVTMAAVVLDIASLRESRSADRAAADLAVTAGAVELDASDPQTFAGACDAAWGYALANRTSTSGSITPPPCVATFPDAVPCDASTPERTATGTIGALTVEITHPVPDSSSLLLADAPGGDVAQSVVPTSDGSSCERLAVRIIHPRSFLFAQVAGPTGGTTDVHSVARAATTPSTTEIPGIVALERTGCDAVSTPAGGGALRVGTASSAGLIVIDSDGSTCGGFTISPGAGGDPAGRLVSATAGAVPGRITSFALSTANFARAYDPGAVGDGRLAPQPVPALVRTGQALIDARYNCATCGTGLYVDQLEAARQGPGPPLGSVSYAGPCTIAVTDPPVQLAGHVYIDCNPFVVDGQVTFLGDAVTFAGDVTVNDTGCLAVNDVTCGAVGVALQDVTAYARGAVTKSPLGRMFLPRTMLYAVGAFQAPFDPVGIPLTSALRWTAPLGGDFEDLLLWSDHAGAMVLGEQASNVVEGTLFAPNATLLLEARPASGLTWAAQAIANRVQLQGAGDVVLSPDASRATGRLGREVRLIR